MKKEFIEKIKSRGYWRINFQPLIEREKFKTLGNVKKVVENNVVSLRGWDYPHFPRRRGEDTALEPGENFYQGWIDWENHKEFWRMYKSGQFLHYMGLREDWFEESSWHQDLAEQFKPLTSLGIISTVYQVTEIYEFLKRLANVGVYDEGVNVSITLFNTENRELKVDDTMRMPLLFPRKTAAKKMEFHKEYSKETVVAKSKNLALEDTINLFDSFGWDNPPIETIKKDQENLLNRRI